MEKRDTIYSVLPRRDEERSDDHEEYNDKEEEDDENEEDEDVWDDLDCDNDDDEGGDEKQTVSGKKHPREYDGALVSKKK